jgi:hypothetical protein
LGANNDSRISKKDQKGNFVLSFKPTAGHCLFGNGVYSPVGGTNNDVFRKLYNFIF